ncbi:MAG: carboxypeptidase-like regulatory domain-containing protein [Paracoccaceae bacterium]
MIGKASRAAVLGAALALGGGEGAMAFGGGLVLASATEGRLVDAGGAPAAGVVLRRRWSWGWTGREGEDRAETDAEGRFRFPEVTGSSLSARVMPHEPSVRVEIEAERGDGPLTILSYQKATYAAGWEAESAGLSEFRLLCRIDAEPSADGLFWGTCRAAEDAR